MSPASAPLERSEAPSLPDEALIAEMERLEEPAILYLPGGRIAAVNSAAGRLTDLPPVGRSMVALIANSRSRRADGSPILPGDLPYARALRGEVVAQGERIDIVLPGGSVYRAVVTSMPVVVEGRVVAALSIWHDFDAFVRSLADGLAGRPAPTGR